MNYYYHPILGLQYNYLDNLFIIDIESIPTDIKFDTEKWIKYIKQTGIMILDCSSVPSIERVLNITEYPI